MSKKIGILTSGGDCAGLNAVIRAVVHSADQKGWETVGILDGTAGLLKDEPDFAHLLHLLLESPFRFLESLVDCLPEKPLPALLLYLDQSHLQAFSGHKYIHLLFLNYSQS